MAYQKSQNTKLEILGFIFFIFLLIIITAIFVKIQPSTSTLKKSEIQLTGVQQATETTRQIETTLPKKIEKPKEIIENTETKIKEPVAVDECDRKNNLIFLEKEYRLYDLSTFDNNDIKFNSDEMRVYGILKNNSSECSAKNIEIKVLLKKGDNIMQEVNLKLKDVVIYSGKTIGYSEKFEVYESLLDIDKYKKRRLKPGITASIVIASVNEPLSDSAVPLSDSAVINRYRNLVE